MKVAAVRCGIVKLNKVCKIKANANNNENRRIINVRFQNMHIFHKRNK